MYKIYVMWQKYWETSIYAIHPPPRKFNHHFSGAMLVFRGASSCSSPTYLFTSSFIDSKCQHFEGLLPQKLTCPLKNLSFQGCKYFGISNEFPIQKVVSPTFSWKPKHRKHQKIHQDGRMMFQCCSQNPGFFHKNSRLRRRNHARKGRRFVCLPQKMTQEKKAAMWHKVWKQKMQTKHVSTKNLFISQTK